MLHEGPAAQSHEGNGTGGHKTTESTGTSSRVLLSRVTKGMEQVGINQSIIRYAA
jgi:hypothetical protein